MSLKCFNYFSEECRKVGAGGYSWQKCIHVDVFRWIIVKMLRTRVNDSLENHNYFSDLLRENSNIISKTFLHLIFLHAPWCDKNIAFISTANFCATGNILFHWCSTKHEKWSYFHSTKNYFLTALHHSQPDTWTLISLVVKWSYNNSHLVRIEFEKNSLRMKF